MAIISGNEPSAKRGYSKTQFRYGMTYVVITFVVLLILNIYCSKTCQELFYESKKASMVEKCLLASDEIGKLDVLNPSTVAEAVSQMESLKVTRLIVTDQSGNALFDSTRAAAPIDYYGTVVGCVYLTEFDTVQGGLIQSMQRTVLRISLMLEVVVVLFTSLFSFTFSRRLNRIMTYMRSIQEGDYTHKVNMGGNDELTILGNEFNDLTERLKNSEEKRSRFVSDASHELKTPLASIKLLADSILQYDMDLETVREFVGDIGDEAERLNRMTAKLLSLTRAEGAASQETEIIYMAPTVRRVARMLKQTALQAKVSFQLDLDADSPILILEDDLYQVVFNLMENGIKYNQPGGILSVRLFREEDNAVLQVSDTGAGIPKDALEHIFERFYRVDKARSRATGGSGLGLSIVRTIVQRNRGEIQVYSDLGQGSTFTVTFPAFDAEVDKP